MRHIYYNTKKNASQIEINCKLEILYLILIRAYLLLYTIICKIFDYLMLIYILLKYCY